MYCSTFNFPSDIECDAYVLFFGSSILNSTITPYNYTTISHLCRQRGGFVPDGGGTADLDPPDPPAMVTDCIYRLVQPYADRDVGESGNVWSDTCYRRGKTEYCNIWVVFKNGSGTNEVRRYRGGKTTNRHFIYPVCQKGQQSF